MNSEDQKLLTEIRDLLRNYSGFVPDCQREKCVCNGHHKPEKENEAAA